ncbi:hypothetical protein KY285_024025 [Solanum tuberosum]|nr:hypothetical protein KY289_024382 [Solanum tuberosum]KAH0676224.1 hypothetical protein KY285_024025 [Solanum tuberosum]
MGGRNLWTPISLRKMTYSSLSSLEPQGLMFQCSIVKARARNKDHFTSNDMSTLMLLLEAGESGL